MTDDFKQIVLEFIKAVPKGRVVSYGQAAAACGKPLAARAVGGILRSADVEKENIPWWRVVNNRGLISVKGSWTASKELQRSMLIKEGIKVAKNYTLDINRYRYQLK